MISKNQTFILSIDTGQDLTLATDAKILYTKPNAARGEWAATVNGSSISYGTANADIDQAWVWKFQAFYKIDGDNKYSSIVKLTIDEHL